MSSGETLRLPAQGGAQGVLHVVDRAELSRGRDLGHELVVTARWGDYASGDIEEAEGSKTSVRRRTPREETLSIPLDGGSGPVVRDVPASSGVRL